MRNRAIQLGGRVAILMISFEIRGPVYAQSRQGTAVDVSACGLPDALARIQAAIDTAGAGGKVYLPACPLIANSPRRCYHISGSIVPLNSTILEGDGTASCIEAKNAAGSPAIAAVSVTGLVIRDLLVRKAEGASTAVGIQLAGGANDTSHSLLENLLVEDFAEANISLRHTYGTTLINVRTSATGRNAPRYGVRLEDGYNNATTIIGGEYKFASEAAIYLGAGGEGLNAINPVIEANEKHGILIKGPFYGVQLTSAYFEQNGIRGNGCDVYVPFVGIYDVPVVNLSIRNASFNTANCTANIENTADLDFSFNTGYPPDPGSGKIAGRNAVVLGRNVSRPSLNGNRGLNLFDAAGTPVIQTPANLAENRFVFSETLTNSVWSQTRSSVSQDGTLFLDGKAAWKCTFPVSTDLKNPSSFGQTIGILSGRIVGNGAWMRTDHGSATIIADIHGAAGYTGSTLNQPGREYLDTNWRWIWTSATIARDDNSPVYCGWRFYPNSGSDTTAVYMFHPQAWTDMVNGTPQYASTQSTPVVRQTPGAALSGQGTVACPAGQHLSGVSLGASGTLSGICN